jgi:hypothetical protein
MCLVRNFENHRRSGTCWCEDAFSSYACATSLAVFCGISEAAAHAYDKKATSHKHDQLPWWFWKFLSKHIFSWKGFLFQIFNTIECHINNYPNLPFFLALIPKKLSKSPWIMQTNSKPSYMKIPYPTDEVWLQETKRCSDNS